MSCELSTTRGRVKLGKRTFGQRAKGSSASVRRDETVNENPFSGCQDGAKRKLGPKQKTIVSCKKRSGGMACLDWPSDAMQDGRTGEKMGGVEKTAT